VEIKGKNEFFWKILKTGKNRHPKFRVPSCGFELRGRAGEPFLFFKKIVLSRLNPNLFSAAREPIRTTISHQDKFLPRKNWVEPTLPEFWGKMLLCKTDSCPEKDVVY